MRTLKPRPTTLLETLLCLAPLLVLYEFVTFTYSSALLSVRYPRPLLFQLLGLSAGHVMWANGLLLAAFCLGVAALYQAPRVNLWSFSLVAVEGIFWSLPLLVMRSFSGVGLFGVGLGRPWPLFAGAAFYDELTFRWLVPSLLAALLAEVTWRSKSLRALLGLLLPVALYLVVFFLLKHPTLTVLCMQGIAALSMTAIAQYRGFTCAAYAQFGYTALGSLLW